MRPIPLAVYNWIASAVCGFFGKPTRNSHPKDTPLEIEQVWEFTLQEMSPEEIMAPHAGRRYPSDERRKDAANDVV